MKFKENYLYHSYLKGELENGIKEIFKHHYRVNLLGGFKKIIEFFIKYHIDDDDYNMFIFALYYRIGIEHIDIETLYNYLVNNFDKQLDICKKEINIDTEAMVIGILASNYLTHIRINKLKTILNQVI